MDAFLYSLLGGLVSYRTVIFILLGFGFLIYFRKFAVGVHEWQTSVFGLEQKIAQRKIITATSGLIMLILLIVGEFLLVTVISPRMPSQQVVDMRSDEPFDDTTDSQPSNNGQLGLLLPGNEAEPEALVSQCIEDVLEITFPGDGDRVSGTVSVIGSVNINNFGSYKYEYSTTGEVNWIPIDADDQMKLDESLGLWYTGSLVPGRYLLRLVPFDNVGEELTPCIVNVEVIGEE